MQDNGRIMKELKELQDGVKNVSHKFYQHQTNIRTYTYRHKLFKELWQGSAQVAMNRRSSILGNLK